MKKLLLFFITVLLFFSSCNSYEKKIAEEKQKDSDAIFAKEGDSIINDIFMGMSRTQFKSCNTSFLVDDYEFELADSLFINDSLKYICFQSKKSYTLFPDYYPDGLKGMSRSELDFALAMQTWDHAYDMLCDRYWTNQLSVWKASNRFEARREFLHKIISLDLNCYDSVDKESQDGFIEKYYRVYIQFMDPRNFQWDDIEYKLNHTPSDPLHYSHD